MGAKTVVPAKCCDNCLHYRWGAARRQCICLKGWKAREERGKDPQIYTTDICPDACDFRERPDGD